jgi:hypothetical protein
MGRVDQIDRRLAAEFQGGPRTLLRLLFSLRIDLNLLI